MPGVSPIWPRLPPAVGSPESGSSRPPRVERDAASGSYGSGSTSLTDAPQSGGRFAESRLLDFLIGNTVLGFARVVVLCRVPVRIGLTGVGGSLPDAGQLRVGGTGPGERLVEFAGGVGDDVGDELQRRDELHAGLAAHGGAQDAGGAGQCRGRVGDLLGGAVDGVEHRRLAQVVGDA